MEDDRGRVIEELQKELDFYQQKIKDLDEIVVKKKLVDDAKRKINLYLFICGIIVIFFFAVFTYKEMNMLKSLDAQKDYLEKILKIEEINLKSYVENKVKEIEAINDKTTSKIADKVEVEYFDKIDEYNSKLFTEIEEKKRTILKQIEIKEKVLLEMLDDENEKFFDGVDAKILSATNEIDEKSKTLSMTFNKEKLIALENIKKEINNMTSGIEPKLTSEVNNLIKNYDQYITEQINIPKDKINSKIDGWVYFGELVSSDDYDNWNFRNFMINFTKSKFPVKGNEIVSLNDMINVRENYFDWVLLGEYKESKIVSKVKKGTALVVTDVYKSENGKNIWVKIKEKIK